MNQHQSDLPLTPAPQRVLSIFDAVMITVGIVIGAGIFKTPAMVAQLAGSPGAMWAAWIGGALLSLVGALTYAELACAFPSAGGDYTFLTRAFGRDFSFFFAWARAAAISTGSIALLGFVLGDYLTRIHDLGAFSSAKYAVLAVCLLTALNLSGLKRSARVQNIVAVCEVGGVLLVAIAGMMASPAAPAATTASVEPGAFGAAMVFVLLAYGGWNDCAYVSAEVRGGDRAILKSLVIAIAVIAAVYLFFIFAAQRGLGFAALSKSTAPGADIMQVAFGERGAQLLAAIVAISALTSMNGTMIVGARANYAVGRDWPLFRFLSGWRAERNAPVAGFLAQAAIALALIVFGAVEQDGFTVMVEFTAPAFWFFFMMSGVALLVLRKQYPSIARPFITPLYPALPLIFIATCGYLLYSSIAYARSQRAGYVVLAVMATGGFAWLAARMRGNGPQAAG